MNKKLEKNIHGIFFMVLMGIIVISNLFIALSKQSDILGSECDVYNTYKLTFREYCVEELNVSKIYTSCDMVNGNIG